MSQLGDAIFTTTQQRVLGLLYVRPEKSFYTREIIRLTGMGVATIKRELDRMVAAGILSMTRIGNQHHHQANPECPIYHELLGIVKKTFGVAEVLREALLPLSSDIVSAFIYGSVASGSEQQGSDIDLMVVGRVSFEEVVAAVYPCQGVLGREINPSVFAAVEYGQKMSEENSFIAQVMDKPRLTILGKEDENPSVK